MAVCSFFGRQQIPEKIEILLQDALIYLIESKQVDLFYLGNESPLEILAQKELKYLRRQYTYIGYSTVLYKPPSPKLGHFDYSDTICLPCYGFPAYAKRNLDYWLINKADYIVTYMPHLNGSAGYFKRFLESKGKQLFNLADFCK